MNSVRESRIQGGVTNPADANLLFWGVLVLLIFQVNSHKLGVRAPQNVGNCNVKA